MIRFAQIVDPIERELFARIVISNFENARRVVHDTEKIFAESELIIYTQQQCVIRSRLVRHNPNPGRHRVFGFERLRAETPQNVIRKSKSLCLNPSRGYTN